MISGKKASEMWPADTILFFIMFGIVLGITSVLFVFVISKTGAEKAKIYENLETLNVMQRFMKSPDCFVYSKDGAILYDVIDYEKFSEQRLNACYDVKNYNFPAFRLRLISDSFSDSIKTINWNENREFEEKRIPRTVMIYFQGKLQKGRIEIEIQNLK